MGNESLGGIEYVVDANTAGLVSSTKTVDNQTKNIENSFKKVDTQVKKTSESVKRSFTGMGRNAGQAGVQIQQFVGQVQGGQSAMLALSQQGADLGIVLGAPLVGAVIGIGASLASFLIPSLKDASDETKTFSFNVEEATEKLENLSKSQVAVGILETSKSMDDLSKSGERSAKSIKELLKILETGKTPDTGADVLVGNFFDRLSEEGRKEFEAQLASERANLDKINQEYEKQSNLLIKLTENKQGFNKETEEQAKKTLDVSESIKAQTIALRDGEEAAFRYATAQQLNLKAGEMIPESLDREITALFRLKQEREQQIKLATESTQRLREEERAIRAKERADLRAAEAAKRAAEAENQALTRDAGGIADRANPLAALEAQKQQELQIIKRAEEQGLKLHTDFATLRANVDAEFSNREKALRQQKFAEESKFNSIALGGIEALGAASTNTLSGLLSGTFSVTDAIQQFANTILTSVIGSLVDVGVQYTKNALISQAADKAILASQQTTGAVNSATHTAAVGATVAELSSLAAAGAFAATAAIPIVGPAAAPGAAAAAGATATGLGAPAIAAAPVAGQREHGGPVSSGQLYEVGERNKPEMLMIPGNNGRVFSNAEMKRAMSDGGEGVSVNVMVNNLPGQTATVSGNGVTEQMVIQIADARIADQSARAGSTLNRNINQTHNSTYRLNSKRRNA